VSGFLGKTSEIKLDLVITVTVKAVPKSDLAYKRDSLPSLMNESDPSLCLPVFSRKRIVAFTTSIQRFSKVVSSGLRGTSVVSSPPRFGKGLTASFLYSISKQMKP
jgi:hypothetical protein